MTFRDLAQSVIGAFDDAMGEAATYEAWQPLTSNYAAAVPIVIRPITRDQLASGYSGRMVAGDTVFRVSKSALPQPVKGSHITHDLTGIAYEVKSSHRDDPLGLDWNVVCRPA